MKNILIFCFFLLFTVPAFPQLKAIVEMNQNSTLTVIVQTNICNFTLVQKGDKLLTSPRVLTANNQKNRFFVDQNTLDIFVKGFKSDNLVAQNEFYKLMNVDQFPMMKIELNSYENASCNKTFCSEGKANLHITITNVTNSYDFPVSIKTEENTIRIVGKKKISIKDFGLYSPKTLFGMIKVDDLIEIDLNILCKVKVID